MPANTPQRLEEALQRIDAIEAALGALTMLAVQHMPAAEQRRFAEALATFGAAAEKEGDMATATLLTGLHGAAVSGSGA
ncbi:hypothetical protein [Delftia sp. WSY_7]|uniref:hypothetical protein n=1 Tax=Delftia sp. WSY_7 TaxID=3367202 RepID=UPI00370C157E